MSEDPGGAQDIENLIDQLSLEEKIARVHGVGFRGTPENSAGFIPPVERLGIPGVKMVDGPGGLNADGLEGTDVPHPIVAASAFDPRLAEALGATIAREARAAGQDVLLAPTMDLFRFPLHSRAAETLGEDPYLAEAMASAYANGIQSEGVVATAKHYACYNQSDTEATPDDDSPTNHDVVVGERALRELYLRPFEAVVREGAIGGVMAAYNKVNGSHASENEHILRDILKGEWKFDGFVVSDWLGTHSTVEAARNGLDVEMPAGEHFGGALEAAVRDGAVSEETVDEKVRRVLQTLEETGGALDDDSGENGGAIGTDEHFDLARRVAEQGSVLLKNDGVLPFDGDSLDSLAVVGPEPRAYRSGVGGSDTADPIREIGPVEGIEAVAGDAVAVEAVSSDEYRLLGPEHLTPDGEDGAGLTGRYFDDGDSTGAPDHTRIDERIDITDEDVSDIPDCSPDGIAARWTGTLTPPATGSFGFRLTSSDSAALYVDGELVAESEAQFFGPVAETGRVALREDEPYDVEIEATGAVVRLEWDRPDVDWFRRAVDAAADCDAAVVVARSTTDYGTDRDQFALPGRQNELVSEVADANGETVVLLNTESPVDMPWVEDVPSVFQIWFPGQEGGTAIANLLFGNANPSGKLPVTIGATLAEYPPEQPRGYPGVDGEIRYDEGVFLGYRGFDEAGTDPLFPFGHGESYTEFEYSDLEVSSEIVAPDAAVEATLNVRNTGDREGAEIVQVYVSDGEASVERPPKELAGFRKVWLAPNEETDLTFELGPEATSFYHPEDGWTVESGEFDVLAGGSSRDVRLTARFERTDER